VLTLHAMYIHAVGRRAGVALRRIRREQRDDGGGELRGAQGREPHLHGVRENHVTFEFVVQPHLRHLRLGCWLSNKHGCLAFLHLPSFTSL